MTLAEIEQRLNKFKGRVLDEVIVGQNEATLRSGRIQLELKDQYLNFRFGSSVQRSTRKSYRSVSEFINDSETSLEEFINSGGIDINEQHFTKTKCLGVARMYGNSTVKTFILEFEPLGLGSNPHLIITAEIKPRVTKRRKLNA